MTLNKPGCYIYPITSRLRTGVYNPYLDNFIASNSKHFEFLNKDHPSDKGLFDIIKYVRKTDIVFFNWIENLPEKKGGVLQTLFLTILLMFKHVLRIKVVWTMHNKFSHSNKNLPLKRYIFKLLLRRSDLILTHSTEGIKFGEQIYPGVSEKVVCFQHPVTPTTLPVDFDAVKEYDILIWGSLSPYKGIDTFLEYLKQHGLLSRYRIIIAGKALNEQFFEKILSFKNEKLEIINAFLAQAELGELMQKSKVVLFTYSSDSILSSGALMDTVANNVPVIGPHKGAFADLEEMGIIQTFNHWDELIALLENLDSLSLDQETGTKRVRFLKEHTWPVYAGLIRDTFIEKGWM